MSMSVSNEKTKQPRIMEMPFTFRCSHCGKDTATLTVKEERKEDFVENTRILVEYIEETETMEGNWFEITDDMKKGLKIACCNCEKANGGILIEDSMEIEYEFIDDEYPQGMMLNSIVRINKKESKTNWRICSFKTPRTI